MAKKKAAKKAVKKPQKKRETYTCPQCHGHMAHTITQPQRGALPARSMPTPCDLCRNGQVASGTYFRWQRLKMTPEERERCLQLFKAMSPVKGETRAIYRCGDCGELFGRRYVPYGLGQGYTVDPCLCQITAHRSCTAVMERSP